MERSENDYCYATIDAKLAAVVASLDQRPDWYQRLQGLAAGATAEERLAVYQMVRDSKLIPEDAGFYLVSWMIDEMAEQRANVSLAELEARLNLLEEADRIDSDEDPDELIEAVSDEDEDEAADEYDEVLDQYNEACDAIFTAELEAHGESAIAALVQNDRAEYERRSEAGREYFFPPDPEGDDLPDWLSALFDVIGGGLMPESVIGPLGFRWRVEEDFWEIDAYPTPVELIGGAEDGALVTPGFSLDLERLRLAFDEVEDMGWNAQGWPDGDGPFVWLEGRCLGHDVFLRILSEAPDGEEPGAKLRLPTQKPE